MLTYKWPMRRWLRWSSNNKVPGRGDVMKGYTSKPSLIGSQKRETIANTKLTPNNHKSSDDSQSYKDQYSGKQRYFNKGEMWSRASDQNINSSLTNFDLSSISKFKDGEFEDNDHLVEYWDRLYQNSLYKSHFVGLFNYWDEIMDLIHVGKMRPFPIDNENVVEEDGDFKDHIFIGRQFVGRVNKTETKNFISLLTNALSHNPHLSLAEKGEHIEWFIDYFHKNSSHFQ